MELIATMQTLQTIVILFLVLLVLLGVATTLVLVITIPYRLVKTMQQVMWEHELQQIKQQERSRTDGI